VKTAKMKTRVLQKYETLRDDGGEDAAAQINKEPNDPWMVRAPCVLGRTTSLEISGGAIRRKIRCHFVHDTTMLYRI